MALGRILALVGLSFGLATAAPGSVAAGETRKSARLEGNPALAKVSGHLLRVRRLSREQRPVAEIREKVPLVRYREGWPEIEVRLSELTPTIVDRMRTLGMRVNETHYAHARVVGTSNPELLDELAAIAEVTTIHPLFEPRARTGSVTSQGDVAVHAADARFDFGLEGTGVQVGILTDSFSRTLSVGGTLSGAGCARALTGSVPQTSGDLPVSVTVLDDCDSGAAPCDVVSDEGAAMGEIIHDLAPGAEILFHSGFNSEADFAQGIAELTACGADVIVDDVLWFNEPMFQDGVVAQAVESATAAGVVYLSAAGNDAGFSIDQVYVDADPGTDDEVLPTSGADLHDFGVGNRFAAITIPSGCGVRLVLQWNDPYSGTLGPGASRDLDLYLCSADSLNVNPDGSLFACDSNGALAVSDDSQSCGGGDPPSGDPFEILTYVNTKGFPITAHLAVEHYCGSQTDLRFRVVTLALNCELTDLGYGFEGPGIFDASSIYGHAAAEGSNTVASVFYGEISTGGDVFPPLGQINANPNSSVGGALSFYFDPAGNPLPGAPLMRFKPDLAAPDGTNTTFFGEDIAFDPDTFPNFFGTSAAAPHAAAVAALLLQEDPALTPQQTRDLLALTALDIESAGVDARSGAGLVEAHTLIEGARCDAVNPGDPGFVDSDLDLVADCTDADDDNDGASDLDDCAPLVNGIHDPAGEIGPTLQLGPDKERLEWERVENSHVFNVYAGSRPAGQAFQYNHTCLESEVPDVETTDSVLPASQDLRYYLVSATNSCGGDGGLGASSTGAPRPLSPACSSQGLDSDADGIVDIDDNCPLQSNATQVDVDVDGLGDACDNCTNAHNLDQQDLDGDGSGDGCDTCTDTDGDGRGDPGFPANVCLEDNCPDDLNPAQADGDVDGLGDVCDPCPADAENDSDGDLLCLNVDNCPDDFNPTQANADGDGEGDLCDICTDVDADGAGNPGFPVNTCPTDNCPSVANSGQEDSDGDLTGDACDPCTDTDGDSLGNPGFPSNVCDVDNCPGLFNPSQADVDSDLIGDVCDPCFQNPDPACQACSQGTDLDGDGVCIVEVVLAGEGKLIRFRANTADPGFGLEWVTPDYVPGAGWQFGVYGVGYDIDTPPNAVQLISTPVPTFSQSIYTRAEFNVPDPIAAIRVQFGADYDDAILAWLNGVEIFRSPEMPAGDPDWNTGTAPHESSNAADPVYEPFTDLTTIAQPELAAGQNVLAVGVWNASPSSTDLILVPRLSIFTAYDNCPDDPNPGQEDTDGDGIGDACDLD